MRVTQGSFESDGHVVLTGPIWGTVTLDDGTTIDVSPAVIEVTDHHAAEVAHLIGRRYAAEGHPNAETFEYDDSHFKSKKKGH